MPSVRPLWLAVASIAPCLLCAAAAAQGPPLAVQSDPALDWNGLHHGETAAPEVLADLVAGDLTGDGRADAVFRAAGGWAVFSAAAADRHGRRVLASAPGIAAAVEAVALQRGGAGGLDAVLTAGDGGVHQWRFDPASGTLVGASLSAPAGGHRSVVVAERTSGALRLGYALRSDGKTVDVLAFVATGGDFFASLGAFSLPSVPSALAAADVDGDGLAELVVGDAFGLRVRSHAGTAVADHARAASPVAPDRLAVLCDDGVGADLVAWVVHPPGGAALHLLAGTALDGPLHLVPARVLDLQAADLDGSGRADLVAVDDQSGDLHVHFASADANGLDRYGSGPSELLTVAASVAPFDPVTSPTTAGVAVADADGDGDLDLLEVVAEDRAFLLVHRNLATLAGDLCPVLDEGATEVASLGGGYYSVELRLDAPPVTAGGDRLRLRFYHRPDEAVVEIAPGLADEVTVEGPTWPFVTTRILGVDAGEDPIWYVEASLENTATGASLPAALWVVTYQYQEAVESEAVPGEELWGGDLTLGGSGTKGSSGAGQVPRIPPPPPPPTDPDPPTVP